ncbi:hypothetical protein BD289DRAFT_71892 [Coniella lustricola]|uniref:Uncharacterized protein n=1 Tax=Coniella lustricola TaxID=2025994 RepID=A0A2T2ZZU6_9PEZI|nr:hypothetical protein BD289DRAFT_71892 [Coniella lustricola]
MDGILSVHVLIPSPAALLASILCSIFWGQQRRTKSKGKERKEKRKKRTQTCQIWSGTKKGRVCWSYQQIMQYFSPSTDGASAATYHTRRGEGWCFYLGLFSSYSGVRLFSLSLPPSLSSFDRQ